MTAAEPDDETAGEYDEPTSRARTVALFVVAAVVVWRVIAALPELAYVVVGVLSTIGVQKYRARRADHGGPETELEAEAERPDVGAALRRLIGDDRGVLLTRLRDDLKLPDTKTVKALLKAADIPWKAVRTREGNGPAVHRDAIPPAPSPAADAHGPSCCCRSGDNGNSNNGHGAALGEGIRVEAIGESGRLVSGDRAALDALVAHVLAEKRKRESGEVSD